MKREIKAFMSKEGGREGRLPRTFLQQGTRKERKKKIGGGGQKIGAARAYHGSLAIKLTL